MVTQINEFVSFIYQDPLSRQYSQEYTNLKIRKMAVDGDFMFSKYIIGLNEEIFSICPTGISDKLWDANFFIKIANYVRMYGWAVVQVYEDEARVFSEPQRSEWLTAIDDNNIKVKIGVKITYIDDLQNSFDEELLFNPEDLCFYLEWASELKKPLPDLTEAIWTLGQHCRNIRNQLMTAASKPGFLWATYGQSLGGAELNKVQEALAFADLLNGLGATKAQLENLTMMPGGDVVRIIAALTEFNQFFAGATNTPLEYYLGKSQSSGLSDVGSKTEDARLLRKKDLIFQRFVPFLKDYFLYVHQVTLPTIEMGQIYTLQDVEESTPIPERDPNDFN